MSGVAAPLIRRLVFSDCGDLAELFRVVVADETAARFRPHPFSPLQAYRIAAYVGRDTYLGAWAGGRLAAYGMLRGWDAGYETPCLGLYVAPEARGNGLGKAVVKRLHEVARYRGAERVRLKVFPDNVAALCVYDQCGYEFDGTLERGELVGFCTFRPPYRSGGDSAVFSIAGAMP